VQLHAHRSDRAEPAAAIPLAQAQFDDVYEAYVQRIYGFVFTHVGNREDAEDVTSQVFIKAYKNLARFEGRGSLQGWLFQIARMAVADFWRERYKLQAVPLTQSWDIAEPESSPELEQPAREARVKQLLEQLPDNYREVLVQRFFLRSSIAETARTLGVTEANARVLQFRALRRAAEVARTEAW
jgi:RNA polymerase sigma-70 factor (ECF subfamily)